MTLIAVTALNFPQLFSHNSLGATYTKFPPHSFPVLTFLIVVLIPVEYLSVSGIAVSVLPYHVRPRVLLVLQSARQSEAKSDRSTAERIVMKHIQSIIIVIIY